MNDDLLGNHWHPLAGESPEQAAKRQAREDAEQRDIAASIRRGERIERWVNRQEQARLAELLAKVLWELFEERKSVREWQESAAQWRQQAKANEHQRAMTHSIMREYVEYAQRSRAARRAGMKAKLEKDPKQAAMRDARVMYDDWRSRKTIHKSGAAFARYVVDNTVLESTEAVMRAVRNWRKG